MSVQISPREASLVTPHFRADKNQLLLQPRIEVKRGEWCSRTFFNIQTPNMFFPKSFVRKPEAVLPQLNPSSVLVLFRNFCFRFWQQRERGYGMDEVRKEFEVSHFGGMFLELRVGGEIGKKYCFFRNEIDFVHQSSEEKSVNSIFYCSLKTLVKVCFLFKI